MKHLTAFAPALLLCLLPACGGTSTEETTASESMDSDTSASGTGETGGTENCDQPWAEKDNPDATDLMETWGAPCTSDEDCVALLGEGGECFPDVLGVFEMPGGYCTKRCNLPSASVTFEHDNADCDPNGGITCVGAMGIFTACAPPCSEHSQCSRDAFGCTRLPVISIESDPTLCLMNEAECCLDPTMCT
jgi:hypothetical protein